MDVSSLGSLISSVGFPIVCFLLCCYYMKYREDVNDQKFEALNHQRAEEVQKMVDAVNNNTLVIQKLLDRMEGNK